ncbi:MAG: TlpA family protein disulfide reductase [Labilithrix sp.]|nr:TlpA family protein disulfide reductase [Labilithrix sp.]MCW5817682.1 TlpA family protein disulfide reductase [Labilithrix sp.]
MMWRGGVALAAAVLAAAALALGCESNLPPEAPDRPAAKASNGNVRVGDLAPDFDVMNASRNTGDRLRLVKGKVNLLFFWSTSSAGAKDAMPVLSDLQKRYTGRGLVVSAIATDEDVMDVARVSGDMGATFDVGWDETKSAQTRYRPPTDASIFIVDKAGVVRFIHGGYSGGLAGDLERECSSLL